MDTEIIYYNVEKVFPLYTKQCCKNKNSIITSNDGNKTQQCSSCGYTLQYIKKQK